VALAGENARGHDADVTGVDVGALARGPGRGVLHAEGRLGEARLLRVR
jgi:hypothetical protein